MAEKDLKAADIGERGGAKGEKADLANRPTGSGGIAEEDDDGDDDDD